MNVATYDQRDATKAPPGEPNPWSIRFLRWIYEGKIKLDRSGPCPCGSKDCGRDDVAQG